MYSENGCVTPFVEPTEAGQTLQFDGENLVWVVCNCDGGGTGDCSCITGAEIDTNGHLIISFDDGSSLDAGLVAGGTGVDVFLESAEVDPNTGILLMTLNNTGVVDAGVVAANRPWRTAGASGANGLLPQPRSSNDVLVGSDIQHIGRVLIGGAIGDTPEEQAEIRGSVLIENVNPEIELRRTDSVLPEDTSVFHVYDLLSGMTNAAELVYSSIQANLKSCVMLMYDRLGNVANSFALRDGTSQSRQVWHSIDDLSGDGCRMTEPPNYPLTPYSTGRYTLQIPAV